jgi:DNA invertase Pin-like site-specific DNA recombinase
MKRVVIYARYSSSKQNEQSIEGQIRVCRAFCVTKNWDVVKTYIDRAKSGRTDNRPEFQKMLEDAPKGNFDIVLVYQLDRFARNTFDSRKNENFLSKYNIRVISATEPVTSEDDEAHEDSFLARGIVELFAENFSRDLSRKVKRGMRETYYKRKLAGPCPFGYQKADDKIVINPKEAEAVKIIFELRSSGFTIPDIIRELEYRNLKKNNGQQIAKNTIFQIIRNVRYTGVFVNPFDEEDIIDDMFPPIVDETMYWKANSINGSKHTKHTTKGTEDPTYSLTGKLFDEESGLPFKGHSAKTNSKKGPYRYYVCKTNDRKIIIKKDDIENEIFDKIIDVFTDNSNLEIIAKQLVNYKSKSADSKEVSCLVSKKSKLVKEQSNLVDLFINANDEMRQLLNDKATALKSQELFLEEKIKELRARNAFALYDEKQVVKELKIALNFKKSDESFKQRAIAATINTIYYNKESGIMTIYFGLKGQKNITWQEHRENAENKKTNSKSGVRLMNFLVTRKNYSAYSFLAQRDLIGIVFLDALEKENIYPGTM